MPPFHSRSAGARRIAAISSGGLSSVTSSAIPSAARTCGLIGMDLAVRGVHAAALADQRAVVVVPAGPGQVEHPLRSLHEARRGIGIGVDEDVPVVEGGEQPNVAGQQHAVAEHVAAHVADADDGEVLGLGVDAHLAEVPLDAPPTRPWR